jgi:hypothetical protein
MLHRLKRELQQEPLPCFPETSRLGEAAPSRWHFGLRSFSTACGMCFLPLA